MALLEVNGLGINFGGLQAVNDFSMKIEKGELYGLIGPNGAGKTTLFNLLTGVYRPTSGIFSLDGEVLNGKNPIQINKKGIARTLPEHQAFQRPFRSRQRKGRTSQFDEGDGYSNRCFVSRRYFSDERKMNEKACELLGVFDLEGEKDILACNLPYGKQRKLEIARALATSPKLLLLDEPAAGMNPNETAELMQTIRFVREKFDMTILLIEHDMKLVSGICERLSVLNFGTLLCEGETSKVLSDPQVIKAYLGE